MKIRMLITMLLAVLLFTSFAGCSISAAGERLDAAADTMEDRLGTAMRQVQATGDSGTQAALTREEAEKIALQHAGFTAEQVQFLRTDYEVDDGKPQYEVRFHQGRWEYDYEIDAQTGKILSVERDD